jgi:ssRNA-specific RNase YbeY (16S rRNA maturation enzyme)
LIRDITILRNLLNVADYQVDILICGEQRMKTINSDFRNKTSATDILSFPTAEVSSFLSFCIYYYDIIS